MLSPSCFFGYDANRDIKVTDQQELIFEEEHQFDIVTDTRIRGELSELLPKQVYEVEQQSFGSLMSGLANYTMADESRVKQALDIAVSNGDLLAVDKDGKKKRRKGSSIKITDTLVAPPQRPFFFLPPPPKAKVDES
ncbi:hypothetical protein ACVSMI_17630 [Pseudomonas aeruginosa]